MRAKLVALSLAAVLVVAGGPSFAQRTSISNPPGAGAPAVASSPGGAPAVGSGAGTRAGSGAGGGRVGGAGRNFRGNPGGHGQAGRSHHRGGFRGGYAGGGIYYGGPVYGSPYAYDDDAYVAGPPDGADDAYCMRRYKSYDPDSGTYLGFDGRRHPCP